MAQFPLRELEIIQLAEDVSTGLKAHQDEFPAPPVSAEQIDQALAAYKAARETARAGAASAAKGAELKDQALETLAEMVKAVVKYAESMTRGKESKLQDLGWGPRRNRTFSDAGPGQVASLQVLEQGKTSVRLGWKAPLDGGTVTAYKVQRRRPGGDWADVGTAIETELTLNGQDSGVEFEYQVIAMNKFGRGIESNIVRALLG